uniref:Uncharacterized protein n=1 Tax=Nelumbo nucifera TaxID=4432 RepID=A0A822Y5B6_NELNU|nr:TPA_asm: hypothetical protein HUJ06_028900 [Nelumbo nucifera]
MLSPNPFCVILLCLPLAFIFTVTSPTSSSSTDDAGATTTNGNYIRNIQVLRNIIPSINNIEQSKNSRIKSKIVSRLQLPPTVIPENDESLFRIASRVNRNPLPAGATKKLAFMSRLLRISHSLHYGSASFFQIKPNNRTIERSSSTSTSTPIHLLTTTNHSLASSPGAPSPPNSPNRLPHLLSPRLVASSLSPFWTTPPTPCSLSSPPPASPSVPLASHTEPSLDPIRASSRSLKTNQAAPTDTLRMDRTRCSPKYRSKVSV